PETSARVFVWCVPDRRPARYCFTARCIRPSLILPANTASERSSFPTTSLFRFFTSTVGILTAQSFPLRHSHRSGPAPRHAQREDCFPDRSERLGDSVRSHAHFPGDPPYACLSILATDMRTIRSNLARDGTWIHVSPDRLGSDDA